MLSLSLLRKDLEVMQPNFMSEEEAGGRKQTMAMECTSKYVRQCVLITLIPLQKQK